VQISWINQSAKFYARFDMESLGKSNISVQMQNEIKIHWYYFPIVKSIYTAAQKKIYIYCLIVGQNLQSLNHDIHPLLLYTMT